MAANALRGELGQLLANTLVAGILRENPLEVFAGSRSQCLHSPRAEARSGPTESFESVAQQPTQSSGTFPKTALCLSSTVPSEL
jgi:hypothetical protein